MCKRNQFFHAIFSLNTLISVFVIQASPFPNQERTKQNIGQNNHSESANKEYWKNVLKQKHVKIREVGTNKEDALHKIAINTAPEEIQDIVEDLTSPIQDNQSVILLTGEPGLGKTTIAQAIASQTGRTCYLIQCSKLLTTYQNSGQQNLNELTQAILELHPQSSSEKCVIVFDEVEQLTPKETQNNLDRSCTKALLAFFDDCVENKNILIVSATNTAEENLHPAFVDRCKEDDGVIQIEKHSDEARKEILQHYLQSTKPSRCPVEIDENYTSELAEKTNEESIRSLKSILKKATSFAKKRSKKDACKCNVTKDDFNKVLAAIQKVKEDKKERTPDPVLKEVMHAGNEFKEGVYRGAGSTVGSAIASKVLSDPNVLIAAAPVVAVYGAYKLGQKVFGSSDKKEDKE